MRWARWEVWATGHTDSGTGTPGLRRGEVGGSSGIGGLRGGKHQHVGMDGVLRVLAAGQAGAQGAPLPAGQGRLELPGLDRGQQRDDVLEVGKSSLLGGADRSGGTVTSSAVLAWRAVAGSGHSATARRPSRAAWCRSDGQAGPTSSAPGGVYSVTIRLARWAGSAGQEGGGLGGVGLGAGPQRKRHVGSRGRGCRGWGHAGLPRPLIAPSLETSAQPPVWGHPRRHPRARAAYRIPDRPPDQQRCALVVRRLPTTTAPPWATREGKQLPLPT